MISVQDVCKRYAGLQVLNSVSFELAPGSVTGLAGPNACGKTTLIKSILGLVKLDSGQIQLGKERVDNGDYRAFIGYMPQNPDFPAGFSAVQLFELLAEIRRREASDIAALIERFALQPFLHKKLGLLSTGTKQKISAVCAFMFDAPVLILDEPTAGFDPVACLEFKCLMKERAQAGATVLIVSHIISELEQMIDRLMFMLDGRIIFHGDRDLLARQTATLDLEQGIVSLLHTNGTARESDALRNR